MASDNSVQVDVVTKLGGGTLLLILLAAAFVLIVIFSVQSCILEEDRIYKGAKPTQGIGDVDAEKCRDAGGLPVRSSWDGRVLECKPLPKDGK